MFLSLLRGAVVVSKCQAMNKKTKKNRKPCMLGWPLPPLSSLQMCISPTTTRRETNKIPKCFSCPGDCKELSKRSTYDSNQARTKPWPTHYRHYRIYRCVSHELRCGEGQIRYQSVSIVLAIVKNCLKRLSEARTTQTKPGPSDGRPDRRPPTTTRRSRSG